MLLHSSDPAAIEAAAACLRHGGLVAFPTETVYGLGADATDDRAVARIFEAKGRPRFNPLIVHVADVRAAAELAVFDLRARSAAAHFWPGPLTLVLRRRPDAPVSLLATAGLDTIAVRVPDHAVARELIERTGRPIAAPSANRSMGISPTTSAHVLASLGERMDIVLDAGPCRVGVESTVLDLSGIQPILLRPGGATLEELEALLGPVARPPATPLGAPFRSPGMLERHYAPDRPLRLDAMDVKPGEALLAFGTAPLVGAIATLNLSPAGDLVEAAANLFRQLRELDRSPHTGIAVMPIPTRGLGLAINDRLHRAAAPASHGIDG